MAMMDGVSVSPFIRNTVHADAGVTTAPVDQRPRVVVSLDLGEQARTEASGVALGWTRTAFFVEVHLRGGNYLVWLPACDVRHADDTSS
jgi:hypothetical protein